MPVKPPVIPFALIAAITLVTPAYAQSAALKDTTIEVVLEGARQENGSIVCRLFDEKGWLDTPLQTASTLPAQPSLTFGAISAGTYAVACFHDADANGKLTFGMFWRPKEGNAFSRDYRPFGPPKFKKAAFEASGATKVTITLEYP